MKNNIQIGNKTIGDQSPCFITFEAGPTHSGLDSAKRLVAHAANAGADAVKFQIFKPASLIADKNLQYSYEVLTNKLDGKTEMITESLYGIFERRYLPDEEWIALKKFSDSLGLLFFATIGDEDGLELALKMGCESIKIASADINHLPLISMVAKTGLCIQLDTGNSTLGEIEVAVDLIRSSNNEKIIIHNCPTGYPAHLESINLKAIPFLKNAFSCPAAYSDHSTGWEMDVAALALGANLIEKTITEDRCTRSVEHIMSLEPSEMVSFVKTIREVEIAMGSPRRVISPEQLEKRKNIRRSIFLESRVLKGQQLSEAIISFKRPGFGIGPDLYEKYKNYIFTENFNEGTMIKDSFLQNPLA